MSVRAVQPKSLKPFLCSKQGRALERHLQEKLVNRFWILKASEVETPAKAASYFPYEPKSKAIARIVDEQFAPKTGFTEIPSGKGHKPRFLINIPVAHLPGETGHKKIDKLVSRLRDEGYGETTASSKPQAARKLAVVIGINQIESIDSGVNREFRKYIRKLPSVEGIAYRVTGFFWKPEWEEHTRWKKIAGVKQALKEKPKLASRIYPLEKAFLLFKCLNAARAEEVRKELEGDVTSGLSESLKTQIPFQGIRQAIKTSDFTLSFAKEFAKKPGNSPVFFMTMDADCKKLRTGATGYFSRYEELIEECRSNQGFIPSVMSLGYQLDANALPLPKLAVKCDMAVRKAMNRKKPGTIYFPEPGTGYDLSVNGKLVKNLKAFSFVAQASGDKSAGLESRRAINNGIRKGFLDQEKFVFDPNGALITSTPARMKTKTALKYETLTAANLKEKKVLKALRAISQAHFAPLSGAHYIYEGLPPEVKKGAGAYRKISGIISKVLAVFDPISLLLNYDETHSGKFAESFDKIFGLYKTYTKAILAGERDDHVVKRRGVTKLRIDGDFEDLEEIADFVQGRFSLLLTAKQQLTEANFTEEWVTKVIDIARASGRALFKTLKEEMDSLD